MPRVLWGRRELQTPLGNTTVVAKTFLGMWNHVSLHPMSLFSNVNIENCFLPPPTETNAMETVGFFLISNCSSSKSAPRLIHSKPRVGPGWFGKSPLITKQFMNLIQQNKTTKKSSNRSGLNFRFVFRGFIQFSIN